MSNVISIRTGKPVHGFSTVKEVFGDSLPLAFYPYILPLLRSPEAASVTIVYGWALRWADELGFDIRPVCTWYRHFTHGIEKTYENDAVFELHTYGGTLVTAIKHDWRIKGPTTERLKRDVRIVRDGLESMAYVHPLLKPALETLDTEPGILILPKLEKYEFTHLDLVGRLKPQCWWGTKY